MTYRQFTTKCLEGMTAWPVASIATCRDGDLAPATAPGGACASEGGVAQWLN